MKRVRSVHVFTLLALLPLAGYAGDGRVHRMPDPVKGVYLIALQEMPAPQVKPLALALAKTHQGRVRYFFTHASTGFSANLTDAQAQAMAHEPQVAFVEEVAFAFDSVTSPQNPAPWQLDRIDQLTGTNGSYSYNDDGTDVLIYVIGHGVYKDHSEFASSQGTRVLRGAKYASDDSIAPGDTSDWGYYPCGSPGAVDALGNLQYSHPNSGHDTAVASMAIGVTQGVAKGAKVVPLRVYNCSGNATSENYNWAFDWIMDPVQNPYYYNAAKAVVNWSGAIGTCDPDVTYLEFEINKVVGHPVVSGVCSVPSPGQWQGIPVVVSANNYDTDVITTSPARMAFSNRNSTNYQSCGHVISVGATNINDQRWRCLTEPAGACPDFISRACEVSTSTPGSNYGDSVDIYAPGANVTPARQTGPSDWVTDLYRKSGTSYAAPIVSGVIARLIQAEGRMNCDQAWARLEATATKVISFDLVKCGLGALPDCVAGSNKSLANRR